MAVPKRKLSRSNTRHRRSSWKATAADLVPVEIDGHVHRVPRRLVRAARRGLLDLDGRG
ncbi:50S ribosomal protein L32 [Aeromicrobium tamlense]|uniref:Large ribosomal subunit protein bL32 n=1 Tax=Aeromicrobium tamlense TaxID=375541 RepID=A0A8I0FT39_9ACTN|nr:50S ribosomal protein L32 [Aeromicrobium tamlense]MBD1268828.1 50S ribosomal protein L32 [Aeromicrobium tamlense]NYI37266.1 large subunit ribosomal protein L32 [Aeromicrobium tamlense]